MKINLRLLFLIFIFFIAFILRFYKLGEIPFGFYQDESAIGYNAYSIIETGKDEYGKQFPLYFKSFGDYKLPVYVYLTVLSEKLLGVNEFAVRFPSAFFGFLSVIIFYFFLKEVSKDKLISLVSTALFAVNPWALHYNRATFEVSISLFLFLAGGLLLYKSFSSQKSGLFLFGTICFVLSLYSYNLTRLLSPVLYLSFIILNKDKIKFINRRRIILFSMILLFLLAPFIRELFEKGGISSASGTLLFSSASILAPMVEFRSYFINFPLIFSKILFNSLELNIWHYLQNIVSYFSMQFLFISGSAHGNHGIGNVGQLYLFEFPLIIVGIIKIIKERVRWLDLFIFWGIISILVASLTRDVPHATRGFFLIVPLEIISGLGFISLIVFISKIKSRIYSSFSIAIIIIFIFYNLIYYFSSYYVVFPVLYSKAWRSEDKSLSLYIKENQQKYDKIIFDRQAGFIYTSLLFYLGYPSTEFQSTVLRGSDDSEGFSEVKSFGKFEFRDVDWTKDYELRNALIITKFEKKPLAVPAYKEFFYPQRPIVFAVKQDLIAYPLKESAYVVVKTP